MFERPRPPSAAALVADSMRKLKKGREEKERQRQQREKPLTMPGRKSEEESDSET
jgi:hypothetical protein